MRPPRLREIAVVCNNREQKLVLEKKKKKIYDFAEKTLVYALEKPSNAAGFPKTSESVSLSVLLSM